MSRFLVGVEVWPRVFAFILFCYYVISNACWDLGLYILGFTHECVLGHEHDSDLNIFDVRHEHYIRHVTPIWVRLDTIHGLWGLRVSSGLLCHRLICMHLHGSWSRFSHYSCMVSVNPN